MPRYVMQFVTVAVAGALLAPAAPAEPPRPGPMLPKVEPPSAGVIALSPDRKFVLFGYSYFGKDDVPLLRLFEVATGKEVKSFSGHKRAVDFAAFTSDGKRMVSGGWDGTYRVWDIATGKQVDWFKAEGGRSPVAALSPDGKLLLAYVYKPGWKTAEVRGWDITTGKLDRFFKASPPVATFFPRMICSPTGKLLLLGTSLIDAKTGEVIHKFDKVPVRAFSADGKSLLIEKWDRNLTDRKTDKAYFVLWDLAKKEEARRFPMRGKSSVPGMDNPNNACAGWAEMIRFSPDGKRLISVDNDRMIRLWDFEKGKEVWSVVGFAKVAAFITDGKELLLVRGWHRPLSMDYDLPWVEYRDTSNGKLLREVKPKGS